MQQVGVPNNIFDTPTCMCLFFVLKKDAGHKMFRLSDILEKV